MSPSEKNINSKIFKEDLEWVLKLNWTETNWKPKDALVDKNSKTFWLYNGQAFDKDKIELVKKGWTHEHCDICLNDIKENDSCAKSDNQIICEICYFDFIKDKDCFK